MKPVWMILSLFVLVGCSPSTLTRIGPPVSPREADCEVEVLEPGAEPPRPYRDVGMVSLENCQDYTERPCVDWLKKAVCDLGGQVAYLPEDFTAPSEYGPVTYRVMVGVYVADLRRGPPSRSAEPSGDCENEPDENTEDVGRCTE